MMIIRSSLTTRRARGFSLIELLVVIGIIGVLIAMLLPTLHSVRESANTLKCMSQLRQIGFAVQQYTIANRGMTPMWSYRHEYPDDIPPQDPPGAESSGPGWPILIESYLGQKPDGAIWNCPSWHDAERRVNYFWGSRWMHSQTPILRSIPISSIRNSTTYIMAGECGARDYYPPPFGTDTTSEFEDIDKDDGALKCLVFTGEDGAINMHKQGNNVLFADNHVATFKKFDPSELTYSPTEQKTWEDYSAP